ncbi:MAG: AMP-binding protein, partial [Rhodanobacteraceae bacterium]
QLIRAIHEHRPTVCFTAPTAYRAMLGMLADFDVSSLRKCVSAGETLPAATLEAWESATGVRIIDGIGATEMLHIFISAAGDDIRPGSTGRAIPGYEARIVDENGKPLPAGEVGLLEVRGPTGCRYLDDDRQLRYVHDGWNYPGDAYRMDENGYFWYVARTDDMIITAGYNVSGPEVEQALLAHAHVRECAVVAKPDPIHSTNIVKAYVVLADACSADTAKRDELTSFVRERIASFKAPREIEFVAALPRTETGKVQRYRLRERAAAE